MDKKTTGVLWFMDIIIIGGQKCGTTYLFELLGKHPQIIKSTVKEIDFFSYNDITEKNVKKYLSYFPEKLLIKMRKLKYLEASPSYLLDQSPEITALRIKQFNKNVKLVCLVRDPVDRAYSAFNMYSKRYFNGQQNWWMEWVAKRNSSINLETIIRRGIDEYSDFELFVDREIYHLNKGNIVECGILSLGKYSVGIKEYLKVFSKNQIIVLKNEDFKNNFNDTIYKLHEMLELQLFNWDIFQNYEAFKGQYSPIGNPEVKSKLAKYYRDYNRDLFELTGVDYLNYD